MNHSQDIISWLKYLDIEYLDDASCDALAALDINDPSDQMEIIRLAIESEFANLNDISKASMRRILDEVEGHPEHEVRLIVERVGMPFKEPLQNYKAFFRRISEYLN